MKFITLILSALMVFGMVKGDKCYKNGENPSPGCNLGGTCVLPFESLLIGKVKERFTQCLTSKGISETNCANKLPVSPSSCFDELFKLTKFPVVGA